MKLSVAGQKMVFVICIAALIIAAVGAVVYIFVDSLPTLDAIPFALGVVLTSALNILKIVMLERTIRITLDMEDPDRGKNYIRIQYLLRYILSGAVLLAAGLVSYYTPYTSIAIGAIIGIFTMQISVIVVRHMKLEEQS